MSEHKSTSVPVQPRTKSFFVCLFHANWAEWAKVNGTLSTHRKQNRNIVVVLRQNSHIHTEVLLGLLFSSTRKSSSFDFLIQLRVWISANGPLCVSISILEHGNHSVKMFIAFVYLQTSSLNYLNFFNVMMNNAWLLNWNEGLIIYTHFVRTMRMRFIHRQFITWMREREKTKLTIVWGDWIIK